MRGLLGEKIGEGATADNYFDCCDAHSTSDMGHSRLRCSRPRLVHVRFASDSDRLPSKRDPALRATRRHSIGLAARCEVRHRPPI
jgi:hypothetical protein